MRIPSRTGAVWWSSWLAGLAVPIVVFALAALAASSAAQSPAPATAPPPPATPPTTQPAEPLDAFAGGIVGSKHDFSDGGRVPRDLCTPCHTPHITAAQAPLLVRRPAATQPAASYRTAAGDLNEASLVCLSCHDGSVAPDVYAGSHAVTWFEQSTVGAPLGRPRMTSHPLGVSMPLNDPTYHSPAAAVQGGAVRLYDGRVQCTSCHDPHNTNRHPGMLWISNERSRQCLACHRI